MSGKREKQKRRDSGISIEAKRGEVEFSRLVQQQAGARAERRYRKRQRNRKGLAVGGLVVVIAALGALALGVL